MGFPGQATCSAAGISINTERLSSVQAFRRFLVSTATGQTDNLHYGVRQNKLEPNLDIF